MWLHFKNKYGKGHVSMLRFRIFAIYMICQRIRNKVLAKIIADIAKHCQKLYAINKTGIKTKGNVSVHLHVVGLLSGRGGNLPWEKGTIIIWFCITACLFKKHPLPENWLYSSLPHTPSRNLL